MTVYRILTPFAAGKIPTESPFLADISSLFVFPFTPTCFFLLKVFFVSSYFPTTIANIQGALMISSPWNLKALPQNTGVGFAWSIEYSKVLTSGIGLTRQAACPKLPGWHTLMEAMCHILETFNQSYEEVHMENYGLQETAIINLWAMIGWILYPYPVCNSSSDHCLSQLLAEASQAILNHVMVNIDCQPDKT